MRFRASTLTMVLALLTVAALIGTGIVFGQQHRGQAEAALVVTPNFPAPVSAGATVVADALPAGDANDPPEQPPEQIAPAIESAPAGPGTVTEGQESSSPPPPTTRPSVSDVDESDESTGSEVDSDEHDEQTADPDHDEDDESEDFE